MQPAATAATGAAPAAATGPAAATPAGQAAAAPANGAVEDEETEREDEAAIAGSNGDTGERDAVAEPDEGDEADEALEGDEEREPVEAGVTAAAAGAGAATAAGRAAGDDDQDEDDEDAEDSEVAPAPVGQGEAGAQGLAGSPPVAPPRPSAPATGAGVAAGRPPTLPDGTPITRGGATGAPGRPTTRLGSPPVPGRGGQPPWHAAGAGQTAIIPPPSRPPWYRRLLASPRYLVLAIAGVLIVGGGAAFGVTQLTKSDSTTSSGTPAAQSGSSSGGSSGKSSGTTSSSSSKAINPKNVTVAVLNGTTVPGLAAQLGDKIQGFGFQLGNVTNSTDQQRAESAVLYAPGHAREAAAVARRLNIGQRERIDPDARPRGRRERGRNSGHRPDALGLTAAKASWPGLAPGPPDAPRRAAPPRRQLPPGARGSCPGCSLTVTGPPADAARRFQRALQGGPGALCLAQQRHGLLGVRCRRSLRFERGRSAHRVVQALRKLGRFRRRLDRRLVAARHRQGDRSQARGLDRLRDEARALADVDRHRFEVLRPPCLFGSHSPSSRE